ncbi:DNA polymerase IV [Spongiibacter tropicus]|nr:DNA polymerase IV [Spongiibacter tropicus]MBO6753758.1 DNA polymerase IV [Spongiibacter sp.]|tara:strand:+ start:104 stop:1150 length:1047 start_codon:yes stop_codon:yes gene_type:complete
MRKIIHCDCDCFYASVEMRDDPSLRGRPLAIGGASSRRGVIATCNYEARAYGVHSALPTAIAVQRCPDLILMPPNMAKYKAVAMQVREIFERYSDCIEPLSLDEAYLDVSESPHFQGSASRIAEAIRHEVKTEVGIGISAGVAPNKFLAKIASDWQKPDGLTVIRPDQVAAFVRDLPVSKIHGVGKVMAAKMSALGIESCEQLQAWSELALVERFGRFGRQLYGYARGEDQRQVKPERRRKSLSVERTFAADVVPGAEADAALVQLIEELQKRLGQVTGLPIVGAFVKMKSREFRITTVDRRLPQGLDTACYAPLMQEAWARLESPVRLMGVGVRFAEEDEASQLSLF